MEWRGDLMVKNWMGLTLILAGLYNALWGAWVILFPQQIFELIGASPPLYPQIWQCVGMMVLAYGLGYFLASYSPLKFWPIVLVGLLGKILGPIGFLWSLFTGSFPIKFGIIIVFNDLIWWVPFAMILKKAWDSMHADQQRITIKEEEFTAFSQRKRAKFINSLSGVKSANLIGTCDNEGNTNLSIVSSVFHLGASPALIGFIIRPDTVRRDTLENIRSNGFYTINHITKNMIERSHQTSARYPKTRSEFEACQLEAEFLNHFKAPFVSESKIKMAVELVREQRIIENGTLLIIGKIKNVILPKSCQEEDGHINIVKAGSIGVSGLDAYADINMIGRLSYAKPDIKVKWSF